MEKRSRQTVARLFPRILKKAAFYFLPGFLLAGFVLFMLHSGKTDEDIHVNKNREHLHLEVIASTVSHELKELAADLNILSSHHELDAYLESGDKTHLDILTLEFLAFSKSKLFYDQIRLIDLSGLEQILINNVNDLSLLAPSEALQNKSDRYYFKEISALNKGEIYLSRFDLNVEHGQEENPRRPIIRTGTPLLDSHDRTFGRVPETTRKYCREADSLENGHHFTEDSLISRID